MQHLDTLVKFVGYAAIALIFVEILAKPSCASTFTLCGTPPWSELQNRPSSLAAYAFQDRSAAYRMLGLETAIDGEEPSSDELKRAFRRAVLKTHPDAEGGDAQQFQRVRDAYEFLQGKAPLQSNFPSAAPVGRGARVWRDGVLESEGVESNGRPTGRQFDLSIIIPGILVAVAVIGLVVRQNSVPVNTQTMKRTLPSGVVIQVPRKRFEGIRGMEYILAESIAAKKGCDFTLVNLVTDTNQDRLARGKRLAQLLQSILDEPSLDGEAGKLRYNSVAAVVSSDDFDTVRSVLAKSAELQSDRYPYLVYSAGRAVARFEHSNTYQELLILEAFDYSRKLQDPVDVSFRNKLIDNHDIDLVVLDLSEPAWTKLVSDFTTATGTQAFEGITPLKASDLRALRQFQ